jgi:hypothetical protein
MDIAAAIAWKYPNARSTFDYSVVADPHTGQQSIEFWNVQGAPQPTASDLQNWWIGYLKDAKIAQLNAACAQTIYAGFTSSASGTQHTYSFDDKDQRNFNEQLSIVNADPTITNFKWKTVDAGIITLTRDQFIALCKDAHTFKRSNIERYWNLVDQVQAAQTEADINAITW